MSNPGNPDNIASIATSIISSTASPSPTISPIATSGSEDVITRGPKVFAVTLIFMVISFVAVALRTISRGWIVRKMRADDWIILVAWILSFGMCFSICLGTHYGFGYRHDKLIPTEWEGSNYKLRYVFTMLYNPAIMITKVSIITFYLSIFTTQRAFRICCWITLAVIVASGTTLTLLIAFACKPLNFVFRSIQDQVGHCIGVVTVYYASAPVNIITDLALLILPMPVLTSLRLPKKQKAILIFVFGLGGFVLVVGIVRIYYFQQAASSQDFNWDASLSFMWAALEVNIGILCASIPMIKPLVLRFAPKWIGAGMTTATSTLTTDGNLDYGTGTFPEGAIPVEEALRPAPRPLAWLNAPGGQGGVVGDLEVVDPHGQISQSFNRSYGGGGDPLPWNRRTADDVRTNITTSTTGPESPKSPRFQRQSMDVESRIKKNRGRDPDADLFEDSDSDARGSGKLQPKSPPRSPTSSTHPESPKFQRQSMDMESRIKKNRLSKDPYADLFIDDDEEEEEEERAPDDSEPVASTDPEKIPDDDDQIIPTTASPKSSEDEKPPWEKMDMNFETEKR